MIGLPDPIVDSALVGVAVTGTAAGTWLALRTRLARARRYRSYLDRRQRRAIAAELAAMRTRATGHTHRRTR